MANRDFSPVNFAMEKNVVYLSSHITFGSTGVPTLDTQNSKGICNFAIDALSFNANSVGSSATLSSVTSFAGLFGGMSLAGGFGSGTISSITAGSGLITLASGTGVVTTNGGLITATGGRFRVQFGTQAGVRLDSYYKFLGYEYSWDMSASSVSGTATTQAQAPSAFDVLLVQNNTRQRTIPRTATSGSTDCSLVLQIGNDQGGAGANFVAANPQAGAGLRVTYFFGNSSAI